MEFKQKQNTLVVFYRLFTLILAFFITLASCDACIDSSDIVTITEAIFTEEIYYTVGKSNYTQNFDHF